MVHENNLPQTPSIAIQGVENIACQDQRSMEALGMVITGAIMVENDQCNGSLKTQIRRPSDCQTVRRNIRT